MVNNLDFLSKEAPIVARKLIGWRLFTVEENGQQVGGTIIETEAYNQNDAASHSYRGSTPRTEVMFGPAGRMYVYFTYGMHWCANIVTGETGIGDAVLIRAIIPEEGLEIMKDRRGNRPDSELTNGPAKLCQALNITGTDNKVVINKGRIILRPPEAGKNYQIAATKRIGISKDTGRLWRFVAS